MIRKGNNHKCFIILLLTVVMLVVISYLPILMAFASEEASVDINQEKSQDQITSPKGIDIPQESSLTHHSINLNGQKVKYAATVGFVPILDDKTGESMASFFFTAYTLEGEENPSQRPITFAFNGGPGSSSIWLHLGAFGPKKVKLTSDSKELLPPPYYLVDNDYSILDLTDLVFIDPIGTGFSRFEGKAKGKDFWGVQEDINVTAEFIRLYLSRNQRWASPLYLAGESYGTTRAAGLSTALQNIGIFPTGIILISPILDYSLSIDNLSNDRVYILNLPTYAATAWYHKKIASRLQGNLDQTLNEVREWCQTNYLTALWKGNTLSKEERNQIINRLVDYTGLPFDFIDRNNLRVSVYDFADEILKNQKSMVSIYDSRVIGYGDFDISNDPILAVISGGPFISTMNDYLQTQLNFKTDRTYIPSSEEAHVLWNWIDKEQGDMGFPNTGFNLCNALKRTGFLRIFVASGLYDLVTPYDNTVHLVNHFDLP